MKLFLLLAFPMCLVAAPTNTNRIVRPPLSAHQIFYTNWTRQYFAVAGIMRTNSIAITRQRQILDRMSMLDTPERRAQSARYDALERATEPARARFKALVTQRLAYESRNPHALQFAPTIRNWQDPPRPNMKD